MFKIKYFLLFLLLFSCATTKEIKKHHLLAVKDHTKNDSILPKHLSTITYNTVEDAELVNYSEHTTTIVENGKGYVKNKTIYLTDTIRKHSENSDVGFISYFIPDTMTIGITYTVKLRIARVYSKTITTHLIKR